MLEKLVDKFVQERTILEKEMESHSTLHKENVEKTKETAKANKN